MGSQMELQRLEVISNNLANFSTAGFKEDKPYFQSILDNSQRGKIMEEAGLNRRLGSMTNYDPGVVHYTGHDTDVAIEGDGFFVIQKEGEEFYTRCGSFYKDLEGRLVTPDGGLVQGESGEIVVGAGKLEIDEEGNIAVNGETVDKLKVVAFRDERYVLKTSQNFFEKMDDAVVNPEADYRIMHKSLEQSNVNPVQQMVEMVDAGRSYEAYQKLIKMMDDINQRSSLQLGKL
jgi:flagellar basal body rod protein FlgG